MKSDYLKTLSAGGKRNFKKSSIKNSTIRYYENAITFVLRSVVEGVDLGRFRCVFYYTKCEKRPRFESIDYPWRDYPHPHIEGDEPCLGSFRIPMMEALEYGEIEELIKLTHNFLNNVFDSRYCDVEDCDYMECGCFGTCCCHGN